MNVTNLSGLFYPEDRSKEGFVLFKPSKEELEQPISQKIPPTSLRHSYGLRDGIYLDGLYLLSGKRHVRRFREIIKEDGFDVYGKKILEFGCSAGRLIRNFHEEALVNEVWGVDIHSAAIHWAQTYLSPPFNFFVNTTNPHLPFEDSYFDFIYAGSIWTHIGELDDAWLLEMRRLLRPEGRILITISDQNTLDVIKKTVPDHPSNEHVKQLDDATGVLSKEYIQFVTRTTPWLQRVIYNRDEWLQKIEKWLKIKSVNENSHGWQTVILFEKR